MNIGIPELIVILIVALLVIGPKKLPDVAQALGKGLAEFKRAMEDVKENLHVDEVRQDINEMKDSLLLKNSYEEKKEPSASAQDPNGGASPQAASPAQSPQDQTPEKAPEQTPDKTAASS